MLAEKIKEDVSASENFFWLPRNFALDLRHPFQWAIKRSLDFSASLAILALLFPMLALVAAIIKMTSKGPIFFSQPRVGKYGKIFVMYKFRTMIEDAEEKLKDIKHLNETNEVMFKVEDDPRITKIGKILRKYSIDEIPQLLNVLKGEMSLVGPRPPLLNEVEKYKKYHHVKFGAIPGITGLWQTSGRADIKEFDDVIKLDYEYIENWNLLLDFKILLKTPKEVITARGAG